MRRLIGAALPSVLLPATDGTLIHPSSQSELLVIFCYPWTGRPGVPNPPRWDDIKGAHGSTPQALGYSSAYGRFSAKGASVFGLSLQDSEWQTEFASRLDLPFALLSDAARHFSTALQLPMFNTGGVDYLERLTLIARDGVIANISYPVQIPERDAEEVLALLT